MPRKVLDINTEREGNGLEVFLLISSFKKTFSVIVSIKGRQIEKLSLTQSAFLG